MATKIIKEIVTDVGGNTTIEYSDDTTQKYNAADVVTAQSNPLTGGISLQAGSSRINFQRKVKVVGNANRYPQSLSNGTDTTANARIPVVFPEAVFDLQVVLGSVYEVYEANTPNSYTDNVTIEYPSGVILGVFRFDGNPQATVYGGAKVVSDVLSVRIPAGATAYIRHYVTVTSGGKWPIGLINTTPYTGIGYSRGTTQTDQTKNNAFSYGAAYEYVFSHLCLLGKSLGEEKSVGGFGDSIMAGSGGANYLTEGWLGAALRGKKSYVNLSMGGDGAGEQPGKYSLVRRSFSGNIDYAVCGLGTNDLGVSAKSLATLQSAVVAVWKSLSDMGSPIYQTTLLPRTTSTDSWATLENQAYYGQEYGIGGTRQLFNDWVRAGAPLTVSGDTMAASSVGAQGAITIGQTGHPLIGFIDLASAVESSFNSGKWRVTGAATYATEDGTHPANASVALMAASIDPLVLFK